MLNGHCEAIMSPNVSAGHKINASGSKRFIKLKKNEFRMPWKKTSKHIQLTAII